MSALKNKIDYALVFTVRNANPNGDPLDGNRPRTTFSGHGEVSDVSLKRKVRNRWIDDGYSVFVQSDDRRAPGAAVKQARHYLNISTKGRSAYRGAAFSPLFTNN